MIELTITETTILNILCILIGTDDEDNFKNDWFHALSGDALKIAFHITGEELSFEDDVVNSACDFLKNSEKYFKDNK